MRSVLGKYCVVKWFSDIQKQGQNGLFSGKEQTVMESERFAPFKLQIIWNHHHTILRLMAVNVG